MINIKNRINSMMEHPTMYSITNEGFVLQLVLLLEMYSVKVTSEKIRQFLPIGSFKELINADMADKLCMWAINEIIEHDSL